MTETILSRIGYDFGAAARGIGRLLNNKEDTKAVFEIMRALSGRSIPNGYARLLRSQEGGRIAYDRVELQPILDDHETLAKLPEGSVGRAYLAFVQGRKISAEGLAEESRATGDEIDSLGYVFRLIPEKPKKDFFKSVDNEGKILRFTARFNTRVPEDVDRRFIISFFLSDDSISIYEPAQKNSGIMEGKFLERRKYKNVDKNQEFITPTDMPIGGDVKINGYNFHILSCDEYTQKYLDTHLI
jgi:hypothetical protein